MVLLNTVMFQTKLAIQIKMNLYTIVRIFKWKFMRWYGDCLLLSFDLGNRYPETLFDVRAFALLLKSLILYSALKMRIYGNNYVLIIYAFCILCSWSTMSVEIEFDYIFCLGNKKHKLTHPRYHFLSFLKQMMTSIKILI